MTHGTGSRLLRLTAQIGSYIASNQAADGAIPWQQGQVLDPWDHVEAAMGLSVAGLVEQAEAAYAWLAQYQRHDGSWWATYQPGQGKEHRAAEHQELHFVAYVATGIWHHFLITQDRSFLEAMWPMVDRALDWVVRHQGTTGAMPWALTQQGAVYDAALLTANASILRSLHCGLALAARLGVGRPAWRLALERLKRAMRHPWLFDANKRHFAMDWFYPILAGLYAPHQAAQRLLSRWHVYVMEGMGCRCLSHRPWVTVAESAELAVALCAAGERAAALQLMHWLEAYQAADGGYWMGYEVSHGCLWPEEKPTWTAGAVLLAYDALHGLTPASALLTSALRLEGQAGSASTQAPQRPQRAHRRQGLEQP